MDAKKNFLQGKLLKGGEFHEVGLQIAGRILLEGRIHADELWDLVRSVEVMETLLSNNVFVMVPGSDWIMFQSKPMEHVARELYAKFAAEKESQKAKPWWMLG